MASTPLINGINYSWASITVNLLGSPIIGITAIEYADKQKIENTYGAGNFPVGRGFGPIAFSGAITLYKEELEALQNNAPNGRIQDLPPFDIIVAYQAGDKVTVHRLEAVSFAENNRSVNNENLSITAKIPLVIGNIRWKI